MDEAIQGEWVEQEGKTAESGTLGDTVRHRRGGRQARG